MRLNYTVPLTQFFTTHTLLRCTRSGFKDTISNYMPIAKLSTTTKLFEVIVTDQLFGAKLRTFLVLCKQQVNKSIH